MSAALERFLARISIDEATGCWLWTGAHNGNGYGVASAQPRVYAHRRSYEHFVGPIPEGLHIDHLCRTTLCVCPEHLEPVTASENTRRLWAVAPPPRPKGWHLPLSHCPHGHPYDEKNTHVRANGVRICRRCNAERMARRAREKREANA